MTVEESDQLIIPRNDKSEYRHLVLSNRMEVLIVSDPESEKAAAAMDMRVGAFSDPEDVPGLAHFLEHMLFYSRCGQATTNGKDITIKITKHSQLSAVSVMH
eukprot:4776-Pyramimonas_sp.AAC.3